jgi:hypothetical protein
MIKHRGEISRIVFAGREVCAKNPERLCMAGARPNGNASIAIRQAMEILKTAQIATGSPGTSKVGSNLKLRGRIKPIKKKWLLR